VRPEINAGQLAKAVRDLQRKRRMSKNKATQALSDPNNLVVTYIIEYAEVSAARGFSLIQSAYAQDSRRLASKARQLRSRLNTVTLRNLRAGATYRVTYRVEVATKKPRSIIGVTERSAAVTFRVGL